MISSDIADPLVPTQAVKPARISEIAAHVTKDGRPVLLFKVGNRTILSAELDFHLVKNMAQTCLKLLGALDVLETGSRREPRKRDETAS